jgi:hypothetical protein
MDKILTDFVCSIATRAAAIAASGRELAGQVIVQ